jgi:hypothetical protein
MSETISLGLMSLLVCFPIAAFAFFFVASAWNGEGWRAALIRAATYWGIAVVGITEVLSVFRFLTSTGLAIAWLLAGVGAAVHLRRIKAVAGGESRGLVGFGHLRDAFSKFDDTGATFLSGIIVILALVGVTAFICPPNTQDSMVYHMPRIVHWLHDRSVGFYSTAELRQLKMPPWSEYAMLQFHGLSGGDRFDNLIQWFAMLGSVVGVSLIAELLGASLRGQVLAALICATIPQGILEASGAKDDYVLGFWLVVLIYYLLAFKQDSSLATAVGIGASLGLACLTKTTAFLFVPPLALAIGLLWRWDHPLRYARHAMTLGALALALNAGHFVRNYSLFGTPLGPAAEVPPKGFKYTNDQFGAQVTISNLVRNVAMHLGTPSPAINDGITSAAKRFLAVFGVDANDPRATWDYTRFQVPGVSRHETVAGNLLDVLLIGVALAVLAWRVRTLELRPSLALALGLVAAFVVYCTAIKWSPWNTRAHLPLFILWSAVIGTVLVNSCPRFATALLGTVLLFFSAPIVFENEIRPLSGSFNIFNQPRTALYFADRRDLLPSYSAAVKYAAAQPCNDIGLATRADQFLYPLYALLGDLDGARNIREIGVTNVSKVYAGASESTPCVIVCPDCQGRWQGWASHFASMKTFGNVMVLAGPSGRGETDNTCLFSFTGWYGTETDGALWWRWSAGKGGIHIAVAQPMEATLDGEIASIQPPNTVEILVNGIHQARIDNNSSAPSPIPPLPLHLKAGDNVVDFVSRNQGIRVPNDDRVLAIAIRNLRTRAVNSACTLVP